MMCLEGPHITLSETLQADNDAPDTDSALDGSTGSASYLSSLASSVVNYKYENGRRYHAFREGAYLVPNDEEEQDRMDLVHHLSCLVLGGKLHLAPIKSPQRVLDLGTGTGIWAMEFADEYPSAEVIGTDLSPIQPKWTPPNCTFEVDDFEAEWVYKTPFDVIHIRELQGCLSNDKRLFQKAFEHLAPGGFLELQATRPCFLSDDDTAKNAESAQLWVKTLLDGARKFGKPIDIVDSWKEKLENVGFVDVHEEIRKVPVGSWAKDKKLKEIGRLQGVQQLQAVDSYTPAIFGRVLGWSDEEIQVFMAKIKNDLRNPATHIYIPVYFIWAKKADEESTI